MEGMAMCWMAAVRDSTGDAVRLAMEKVRRHEAHHGGHSWGYAALTDEGLVMDHGLGRMPYRDWPDADVAVGHTRLATRGEVNVRNAHPFRIQEDGRTVAALCHNGTWREAPPSGDLSDTAMMAMTLESYLQSEPIDDAVAELAETTGETFLVLTRSGDVYCHAGRYDITFDGNGFASSGGHPLEEGDIFKDTPNDIRTVDSWNEY